MPFCPSRLSIHSSATSERDALDDRRGRGRIDVRRERDDDARGVRDAGDGEDDAWEGDEGDDAIDIDRARGADDDVDARGTSWDARDARGGVRAKHERWCRLADVRAGERGGSSRGD